MEKEALQWHPAFYAGLQIELQEDKENLIFENEHQLGTKPKEIDVLVIKKEKDIPVKKNIGKIFRKYNIVEYKSPTDYLSIDSFYKGCAYAFLCERKVLICSGKSRRICKANSLRSLAAEPDFCKCTVSQKADGAFKRGVRIPD